VSFTNSEKTYNESATKKLQTSHLNIINKTITIIYSKSVLQACTANRQIPNWRKTFYSRHRLKFTRKVLYGFLLESQSELNEENVLVFGLLRSKAVLFSGTYPLLNENYSKLIEELEI
jgi:hypothetical protein